MYKTLTIVLIAFIGIAGASNAFPAKAHLVQRAPVALRQQRVGLDLCPTCINIAEQSINILLNLILDSGIIGTCGTLCQALADKTGSQIIGAVCDLACDFLGIEEFLKVLNNADLDPIWYCEIAKFCPSKCTSFSRHYTVNHCSLQSKMMVMRKSPNSRSHPPRVVKEPRSPSTSPTSQRTELVPVNLSLRFKRPIVFHWATASSSKPRSPARTAND